MSNEPQPRMIGKSMNDGVRVIRGRAEFKQDLLYVNVPAGYRGTSITDPSDEIGFAHSFLRPYRRFVYGYQRRLFDQPTAIAYIIIDGRPIDGIRCAGAIGIHQSRSSLTFCYFPAHPKSPPDKREVDYFTAHIKPEQGRIISERIHAKIRMENSSFTEGQLALNKINRDDYHISFETWFDDIRLLDPIGSIKAGIVPTFYQSSEEVKRKIQDRINQTQPRGCICTMPSLTGKMPIGLPLMVR